MDRAASWLSEHADGCGPCARLRSRRLGNTYDTADREVCPIVPRRFSPARKLHSTSGPGPAHGAAHSLASRPGGGPTKWLPNRRSPSLHSGRSAVVTHLLLSPLGKTLIHLATRHLGNL